MPKKIFLETSNSQTDDIYRCELYKNSVVDRLIIELIHTWHYIKQKEISAKDYLRARERINIISKILTT